MDEDVRRAPLFAALEDEAAGELQASMTKVALPRGHVLFTEGEPGDRLFIVNSGKIKLGRTSSDGRENLLAVLGPGEMFGELSLFDPGPRTATATAVMYRDPRSRVTSGLSSGGIAGVSSPLMRTRTATNATAARASAA